MTNIPNSPKIMKYHIATNDQAISTSNSAIGTSTNHFRRLLSVSVTFQILAADPANEVGAETTTFSDASLFDMIYIFQLSGLDFA